MEARRVDIGGQLVISATLESFLAIFILPPKNYLSSTLLFLLYGLPLS